MIDPASDEPLVTFEELEQATDALLAARANGTTSTCEDQPAVIVAGEAERQRRLDHLETLDAEAAQAFVRLPLHDYLSMSDVVREEFKLGRLRIIELGLA